MWRRSTKLVALLLLESLEYYLLIEWGYASIREGTKHQFFGESLLPRLVEKVKEVTLRHP